MKFTAIEVENIFAYGGNSRIDLAGCSQQQNIILIRGRNGAGKTSLLNAIKLLFLGSADESLRRVGFGGTPINRNHYVLGQPGRWYGVFNATARPSGSPARVALEWEQNDKAFKAQRLFRPVGASFTESLSVTVDGTPLEEADAEATMVQLLPKEVVPFFFFDGEQIQSIADAEIGRERAEVERLLGLSFIVHLTREIDTYSKAKRRSGLPEEVQVRITIAENAQRKAQAEVEAAGRARVALEEEILDLEREKRRLDTERNRLRTGLSEADRRRMVGRIAVLASQRETLAADIAEQVPGDVIWFTNLPLVREAFEILDRQLAGAADASLADRLHRELADVLATGLAGLEPPVELTDSQRSEFRRAVSEALEEAGVAADAANEPLLSSLSPKQVRALRDKFLVWAEQGAALAARHADMLRLMRQLTVEQLQAQRDLDEAELTSDEARERFEELTGKLAETDRIIRERSDKVAEHRVAEQRAQREKAEREEEVRRAEAQFAEVTRQNAAYQKSLRVKRALEDYRERRRGQIRASVEARLNDRVGILLAPSELISSVELDDQFGMTYYDASGEEVARHSISAGMRQLLAMSMLWALKDEAARPLPVIIDTPLGRIDRQNRSLLMTEYFPNAGNPLILLPTNSEISEEELASLDGRICRRYEIRNAGGQDAQIVREAR